jgi:Zn-dependent protease with chaperone function
MTPHPAGLIRRLGVSEPPAAAAIVCVALLQYLFLARLWIGYPIEYVGDVIHPRVVLAGLLLALGGSVIIIVRSIRGWLIATRAARELERPATNASFNLLETVLKSLVARSSLGHVPILLYTPRNAEALQVSRRGDGTDAIVVGLNQRARAQIDPEVTAAMLGHEISHLELGSTWTETTARRAAFLHFRTLAWLIAIFMLVVGFIDPTGIGSRPRFGGFDPVFDSDLFVRITPHLVVLVLSSLLILVYSYFFLVRREHVHDLRGSQLAQSDALARRVFGGDANPRSARERIENFLELHPSADSRARVINERDMILLSPALFPLIVGGIPGPLLQLLTAGWRAALIVPEATWSLGLTVFGGLLYYLVLSADLVRLGLAAVLKRQRLLLVLLYAACGSVATQLPRLILEIVYGIRDHRPIQLVISRFVSGSLVGGGHMLGMIAISLAALAYVSGCRIAAYGEQNPGKGLPGDRLVGALVLIGAFAFVSLKSTTFMLDVSATIGIILAVRVAAVLAVARCDQCRGVPWSALRLATLCRCGQERMPYLRSLLVRPAGA